MVLQQSEPSSSGISSSNNIASTSKPAKLTAAMLGITRKKRKNDDETKTPKNDDETKTPKNDDETKTSKNDDETKSTPQTSKPKTAGGGLTLLSGYSSASDSSSDDS